MKAEKLFAEKLQEIVQIASKQGNCVAKEQVWETMQDCRLSEEQMELVFSYLVSHKIGIGEPVDLDDYLSDQ